MFAYQYGLNVRIVNAQVGEMEGSPSSFYAPVAYTKEPSVYSIEDGISEVFMVSISRIKDASKSFVIRVSIWAKESEHLESVEYSYVKANPKDLRPAFLEIMAPMVERHKDKLTQSLCTHFEQLADLFNISPNMEPKALKNAIKLDSYRNSKSVLKSRV